MAIPASVTVIEVGLRDGLQNDPATVATADKLRLLDALRAAGIADFEVTSFVRPDLVPKMADAEAVASGLRERLGPTYVALVGNERGYERAVAAGLREVAFVLAATDAFNERNVRRPVDASLRELAALCTRAAPDGIRVKAGIAVAFGCPFSGPVSTARVRHVAEACVAAGADDLIVADTIGIAGPALVTERLSAVRSALPGARLTAHFHDTRGLGMANVWAALQVGIDRFDASIAGLGGCPFAPGATGNIATEDLVHLLQGAGIETGIDLDAVFRASQLAEQLVGRPAAARMRAGTYAAEKVVRT